MKKLQESSASWESAQQDLKSKLQTALKEGVQLLERVQLLEEKAGLKDAELAQMSMLNEVRFYIIQAIALNQHALKIKARSRRIQGADKVNDVILGLNCNQYTFNKMHSVLTNFSWAETCWGRSKPNCCYSFFF